MASKEEKLFAFVPDFYVDVVLNAYNALRGYFHPTISYKRLEGFDEALVRYAQFLSDNVADSRIVHSGEFYHFSKQWSGHKYIINIDWNSPFILLHIFLDIGWIIYPQMSAEEIWGGGY